MFRTPWLPRMKPSKSPVTSVISDRTKSMHREGGGEKGNKRMGKKSRPKTKIVGEYAHPKM